MTQVLGQVLTVTQVLLVTQALGQVLTVTQVLLVTQVLGQVLTAVPTLFSCFPQAQTSESVHGVSHSITVAAPEHIGYVLGMGK